MGSAGRAAFEALALDLELCCAPMPEGSNGLAAKGQGPGARRVLGGCAKLQPIRGAYFSGPGVGRASTSVLLNGQPFLLEFHRGRGRVVLIADVSFLDNRRVQDADNGVFAFNLAYHYGRAGIVFDEYYHGLHHRPSVVRLMCAFPINVVTATLLVCVAALVLARWRHFGPPVPYEERSRRSKAEHVRAMASLFRRCRKTRLALRQLVSGLMWELGDAYGLGEAGAPAAVVEHFRTHSCVNSEAIAGAFERASAAASSRSLSERRMLKLYDDLWRPARKAIDAASERTL
jgi:hypothetical protein